MPTSCELENSVAHNVYRKEIDQKLLQYIPHHELNNMTCIVLNNLHENLTTTASQIDGLMITK